MKNIVNKTVTKNYKINGQNCAITMQEVKIADIGGSEKIMDEDLVNNTFEEIAKAIKRNSSKYNPVPKNIIIGSGFEKQEVAESDKINYKENIVDDEFIYCYKPKWSLNDVYIDDISKKQILAALTISKNKDKLFIEWGLESSFKTGRPIILNFFGKPGTGKSIAAEAMADYLNKEVCWVNYSQLESKYVGQTPKNIEKVFEIASKKDAVVIFDEADSFLGKRITNVNQSADYGVNITRSVMLLELEKFDGIVIFTTNLLSNYDDAFKRRILASIEFKIPDEDGREAIWKTHIPEKMPLANNITSKYLAKRYENISGADIKDILLSASVLCIQREADILNIDDFDLAYDLVMNRYKKDLNFEIKNEVITKEEYENEIKNTNEKTKAGA